MIVTARLKERMEDQDVSQAELARRVGVSQQTIGKLVSGSSQSSAYLHKIARALKTTAEYLDGETDEPSLAAAATPAGTTDLSSTDEEDDVLIDMIDLAYGMGGAFLDSDQVEVERVKFSRSWLRQFTNTLPRHLVSTRGIGDSMMPTIHDRDVVIIDKSQTRVELNMGEKIWACVYGGVGMIKRLRPMPDGTVKISSDNLVIRDEVAADGDLFIVGRVIAVVRSV
jgi:phage repressor protein C with HTH and peptisase S24 domain